MHRVDCARLLAEDSPDALVLAVLCDFQDRSPRGGHPVYSGPAEGADGRHPGAFSGLSTELEAWAGQVLDGIGLEQIFPDA
ncbi:hypothetical protein HHS34_006630 [Acidithiobacillus montserratensis]|uniref:Uncharacterized protein n=1 Tax=Acidithiobacillus montserratensis TaxID=2729135 RepID=A0ACD5HLP4_9PROT|nr:hypothetical protein [Acidithiobacillus montserratensis]MBN2680445.1 hypothetical protein [Acidithiobacillaceae bacterium]MBU2748729.1 hypothetical protein [Acidithiobacillus montserratensis]